MANVKNFGLIGVGTDLQFGKAGTRLINNAGTFNFKAADGSTDAAVTASSVTTSAGDVTATTGNLVLSATAGTISIGGDTTLSRQGAGVFQLNGAKAFIAPTGNTAARPTGATGMVRVNNDVPTASTVEFFNGTAWTTLGSTGSVATLQTEVDNIELTLGTMVNSNGTTNVVNVLTDPLFGGATDLTTALNNLAAGVEGINTLEEIFPVGAPGNVIYGNPGGTDWAQGLPGATSGVQAYDAGLTALAAKTSTGLMVQTGADTYTSTSLTAPTRGFTITNASGVAGSPTFVLANNLSALEANTTPGYYVITADGTSTSRTFAGAAGEIVVTNGDGVSSNTDIGLATVTNAGTGTFLKLTRDGFGRVSGTTAVVTGDITTLVDGTYVNITGDSMSGSLSFTGGATVTGLPDPTNATDAATKNYVDNAVTGLSWKQAVHTMSTTNVTISNPGTATFGGHTVVLGDRILLTGQTAGQDNGIYIFDTTSTPLVRSSDANTFEELNGASVFVEQGTYANTGWVQTAVLTSLATPQTWVQFSGAGAYTGGVGIDVTGNVISAILGAGVTNLPSGEIGLDIVAAEAIQLTTLLTGGQLTLVLEGAGGLQQSGTGLKISAAGVTNAMLANSSITLNADSGSGSVSLGGTQLIQGTALQGISTSVTGSTYTVTAANATTLAKGVASFNSASFSVSSGAVTLSTVDVAHGGTGVVTLGANQVMIGNGTSPVITSAGLTFVSGAADTLTIGGANGGTVVADGVDLTVTATSTNGNVVLMPTGTGSVIVGPAGSGKIQSDAGTALLVQGNTTLTLKAVTGNVIVDLSGTSNYVTVSGPTAAQYAAAIAAVPAALTNKQYVDDAIASGASAGAIKAYQVTVPLDANGTVNIGTAMPAGATVLSVKVVVSIVDSAALLSIGKSGNTSAYMSSGENDAQVAGMYMAECFVTEGGSVQVLATVSSSATDAGATAKVIFTYQVAQ